MMYVTKTIMLTMCYDWYQNDLSRLCFTFHPRQCLLLKKYASIQTLLHQPQMKTFLHIFLHEQQLEVYFPSIKRHNISNCSAFSGCHVSEIGNFCFSILCLGNKFFHFFQPTLNSRNRYLKQHGYWIKRLNISMIDYVCTFNVIMTGTKTTFTREQSDSINEAWWYCRQKDYKICGICHLLHPC